MLKERLRYNVVNHTDKQSAWGSRNQASQKYMNTVVPVRGKRRNTMGNKFRQGSLT